MPQSDADATLWGPSDTRVVDERELERARQSAELQPGNILDGFYELVETLGSGGMGTVYKAQDRRLQRDVAIKVIRVHMVHQQRAAEAFIAEARAMARVHHPNVVTIYAFGSQNERPYLVMEYVPGPNLATWRERQGRISVAQAIEVLDPLCRGAQAIHDAGTVHRDLKPGNVLIGPSQRVAVTDFGLARSVDRGAYKGLEGTPAYLAPEIARGDVLSPALATRIDIYALAVMAFELLTGQPPFSGKTITALLQHHAFQPPPRPSDVNPRLPPAFNDPLLQALSKAPADRQPTAEAFRRSLVEAFERSARPSRSLRVMVVDDEPAALLAVEDLLSMTFEGADVITVSDPATAFNIAQREPPDIVITDLHMTHGGGLALTRALREHPATRAVPIIVMTGYGGGSDWRELRALGADRFLVKPVHFDTLIAMVRSLTERSPPERQQP